jgi:hypothetical protein
MAAQGNALGWVPFQVMVKCLLPRFVSLAAPEPERTPQNQLRVSNP